MIPSALSQAVAALPTAAPERVVAAAGPGAVRIGGRAMVNMASNDYLGFAHDPRVVDAARAGEHPIVPVFLGDERLAATVSARLQDAGVFATALAFPIVARGEARIRLQASAAHSPEAIGRVLAALAEH